MWQVPMVTTVYGECPNCHQHSVWYPRVADPKIDLDTVLAVGNVETVAPCPNCEYVASIQMPISGVMHVSEEADVE